MSKKIKNNKNKKDIKFKRLSDKEYKALVDRVHKENYEFERMLDGIIRRHSWSLLLKDAVKNHSKKLDKATKHKLECISRFAKDVCEEDVIDITVQHFSKEVSGRRRTLSIERALRRNEAGKELDGEEKLLVEMFGK